MGTEFQNVGWNVVEHGTVLFRTHTRPFRNTGLRVCVCVKADKENVDVDLEPRPVHTGTRDGVLCNTD